MIRHSRVRCLPPSVLAAALCVCSQGWRVRMFAVHGSRTSMTALAVVQRSRVHAMYCMSMYRPVWMPPVGFKNRESLTKNRCVHIYCMSMYRPVWMPPVGFKNRESFTKNRRVH